MRSGELGASQSLKRFQNQVHGSRIRVGGTDGSSKLCWYLGFLVRLWSKQFQIQLAVAKWYDKVAPRPLSRPRE